MKPGIQVTRVWFDDDVVELLVEVSDGTSVFSNQAYVGHTEFAEAVSSLSSFKEAVHGGLLEVQFGAFGPEYASGAFHGRFHFPAPGRLFVSCRQEGEHRDFAKKTVASEARLYLSSEPALLDRFIAEMQGVVSGAVEQAHLEGI